ncbi:regucalcin-like [Bacillus rossius redtenbacheri]|uniref:regucalcin-like n=1 Tax=Bacillus rossius redtenbacheri TaxID=93214 RepID=UPI002FDEB073
MSGVEMEVVSPVLICGEGPHWSCSEQVLYSIDIPGRTVRRYDPATKSETFIKIDQGQVTFVIPLKGKKNKFLIGVERTVNILSWDGKQKDFTLENVASVDDDKPRNRINDAKADPSGRLWAGTMGYELSQGVFKDFQGSLYCMDKSKCVVQHEKDVSISNGLDWSPDKKTLYFVDSNAYKVYGFDFDNSCGKISNKRTVLNYKEMGLQGFPDGMTVDTEGKLWVASYGGQEVVRVDPKSGRVLQTVKIPAMAVTSLAFGGPELNELYVTTASERATAEEKKRFPNSGCTFRVTGLGFKGLPPNEIDLF